MTLLKTMEPPNGFQFVVPKTRPFRIVSIETELDGDGEVMARELFNAGITTNSFVNAYGYYPKNPFTCLAFIKRDGSVSAGELVLDRLDLTNKDQAAQTLLTYTKLYELEKKGVVAQNPNCGGHISIDASGYGFWDALRLIDTFGYIEEPIFRLAGAGKKYGHRSLYPGHDRANYGNGYSNPVIKGPFKPDTLPFKPLFGAKRMSAINVNKFFSARRECMCGKSKKISDPDWGAVWDPKQCTCSSHNKLFEWRVWNTQINPRIIYAWIGLMQALHAYTWRPPSSTKYKEYTHMDPLAWGAVPFSKMSDTNRKVAQKRVEWMFCELPMTDEEKDALAYTFMRTPYKIWGKQFFVGMAKQPFKPPPHVNNYVDNGVRRTIKPAVAGREAPPAENPFSMDRAREILDNAWEANAVPPPAADPQARDLSVQLQAAQAERMRLNELYSAWTRTIQDHLAAANQEGARMARESREEVSQRYRAARDRERVARAAYDQHIREFMAMPNFGDDEEPADPD